MITIDQLKAAMSIKGQYEQADEKTVGNWRNTKAATGVYTFQHMVAQWLFFSKGTEINPSKFPGWSIDGWMINVTTEKNKNSSSKHTISVVFDKRNGIDKFWSEFVFISSHTPSEVSLFREKSVPEFYPLSIVTNGAYSELQVVNPETGEVEYTSKKFYKKNAKTMYEEDEEFHKWFDKAVDYACKERISKGLLKVNTNKIDEDHLEELNPIFEEEEEKVPVVKDEQIIEEYEQPAAEIEEEVKPKKRGRPSRKKEAVAPTSQDSFLEENSIIEEEFKI